MKKIIFLLLAVSLILESHAQKFQVTPTESDLQYATMPKLWDEAVPLGNAFIGALVWQKNQETLRMSLDRIDLWDLRPSDSIVINPKTFEWVYQQVQNNNYGVVQKKYDVSYEESPAPSKIPGAALEFNITPLGEVADVRLYLRNALCSVKWKNGATLHTFVHSSKPIGWFVFDGVTSNLVPQLIAPTYNSGNANGGSTEGQDLGRLGYTQGDVVREGKVIKYHQKGWGDFYYDVVIKFEHVGRKLIGAWTITSSLSGEDAEQIVEEAFKNNVEKDYDSHKQWWREFWAQSSVSVPDHVIQKQYDNEMYKVGSLTRENSPIIPLQGVWTADNGKLPPWKGDVHNDLNTELSYWPVYTGNQLRNGYSFLYTLWNQRETSKAFTKQFFEVDGLNVPGVATLTGEPMGGWIQYAFSPSTAAWLSQHFYLNWRYSMDKDFLREVGYPFVKDAATFIENFSKINDKGERVFPLGSSPEIYDNSIKAWFKTMTNYDLALSKFLMRAASEMAQALDKSNEAEHWKTIGEQFPDYALAADGSLAFAKGYPYAESHRHLSNAMAIHPLAMIDVTNGEREKKIIDATIAIIEKQGSKAWTGYSFSWFANMKARAYDGEGAAILLQDFANYFCLSNTFHANGDQKKSGRSNFTYRPFTLEGNMAFASGVQDMLIQSHRGYVEVFPAIPASWRDVSFTTLRTQGAFLVSAKRVGGKPDELRVTPEVGGTFRLRNPFGTSDINIRGAKLVAEKEGILEIETLKGKQFTISVTK